MFFMTLQLTLLADWESQYFYLLEKQPENCAFSCGFSKKPETASLCLWQSHKDENKEKCVVLIWFQESLLSWFQGLWGETCWAPTLCYCQVEPLTLLVLPESEPRGASIFLHHPTPRTAMFYVSLDSCSCLQAHICLAKFMESRAGLELVHVRHHSFTATHCTCTTI